MIRLSPIRLIGEDGEQLGVVETPDAMRMAQDAGLDLVEVVSDSRPPVCKIMDYGKYKYELSKRANNSKSTSHELKEIRLGRSIKIDKHDVQIRVDQARRFLIAGHKVSITQRFRGREIMHKQLGEERLFNICTDLSDVSKVEMPPRGQGRAISVVLAPDKPKIESYVAKQAAEGKRIEEEDLAKLEAEVAAQNAKLDAQEKHEDEQDAKKEKHKGPKDDRASNPVDDEIADLLGG